MSVSDLIKESKLPTRLGSASTTHTFLESTSVVGRRGRRREREEVWKKKRHLGIGIFGTVWLEECASEDRLRAVKEVRKSAQGSNNLDYQRELEAFARFSKQKVCILFMHQFESRAWQATADLNQTPVRWLLCDIVRVV